MTWMDALQVGTAILLSLGGGSAIVLALSTFLAKVWAARILEQDRLRYGKELEDLKGRYQRELAQLRGNIDKAVLVHRVQFEKEFAALSETWACVARLRAVLDRLALRKRDGSNFQEWLGDLGTSVGPAFDALVRAVDDQSPFYPELIYRQLSEALEIARVQISLAQVEDPKDTADYYKRANQQRREFEAKAKEVSDSMRARLANLVVLEQEPR